MSPRRKKKEQRSSESFIRSIESDLDEDTYHTAIIMAYLLKGANSSIDPVSCIDTIYMSLIDGLSVGTAETLGRTCKLSSLDRYKLRMQ